MPLDRPGQWHGGFRREPGRGGLAGERLHRHAVEARECCLSRLFPCGGDDGAEQGRRRRGAGLGLRHRPDDLSRRDLAPRAGEAIAALAAAAGGKDSGTAQRLQDGFEAARVLAEPLRDGRAADRACRTMQRDIDHRGEADRLPS